MNLVANANDMVTARVAHRRVHSDELLLRQHDIDRIRNLDEGMLGMLL
jgi:hypothetical protein